MDKELQKNRKKNKKMINKQKHQQYIERKYCYNCNETGKTIQLFCSVYVFKIYCEKCLNILTDDNGEKLKYHKFEPI